jgi:hypothetical protein
MASKPAQKVIRKRRILGSKWTANGIMIEMERAKVKETCGTGRQRIVYGIIIKHDGLFEKPGLIYIPKKTASPFR